MAAVCRARTTFTALLAAPAGSGAEMPRAHPAAGNRAETAMLARSARLPAREPVERAASAYAHQPAVAFSRTAGSGSSARRVGGHDVPVAPCAGSARQEPLPLPGEEPADAR
jgi:hypothetical protein